MKENQELQAKLEALEKVLLKKGILTQDEYKQLSQSKPTIDKKFQDILDLPA